MTSLLPHHHSVRTRDHALVVAPLVVQTVLAATYVWALWALAGVPDADKSVTLSVLYAPIELLATVAVWQAARGAAGPTRRAWTLVAAGMVCSAIVNVDWVWVSLDPSHRFGWPAFAIVYAQYPLALWAFASFPSARRDDVDRRTYLLDSAIVLVAGAVLSWHFLFRELLARTGATVFASARAIAYAALCLTVLSGAMTLFVRRPPRRLLAPLALLTAGWVMWTVANTLQMRATVLGASMNDATFNACFAAGAWLVAVAATVARVRGWSPARLDTAGATTDDYAPAATLLPYAAIAGVFGVLLLQARHAAALATRETTAPLTALVGGAIAVTAIVVVRQIAAQRRAVVLIADRLRRDAHFRALVQHASDVVVVVDAQGMVREATPSVEHTLGLSPGALVGCALADVVVPEDQEVVRADLAQIVGAAVTEGRPRPSAPCEWRVVRPGGEVRWLEVLCTNLLYDAAVRGIVINGRDVSERKALEAELTRQAYHDSLTGLVNRARFRTIVEEALHRRSSGSDMADRASLAVLYIDLDDFKPVNDSLGHGAGDRVLAVVTERLRDATRGSDVVARIGGDEFAVLLEHVRDADEAAAVARRVLTKLQQPIVIERSIVGVGASIGIACADVGRPTGPRLVRRNARPRVQTATCDALLRDADEAMYAAKQQGGRRYVVFAPRVAGS